MRSEMTGGRMKTGVFVYRVAWKGNRARAIPRHTSLPTATLVADPTSHTGFSRTGSASLMT